MPVNFTNGPIQRNSAIRGDSAAHMIADIHAMLDGIYDAEAVTGGWKYTLQSPDGLRMKLWIQDLGDHTVLNAFCRFTPTSYDETLTGRIQGIVMDSRTYQVWANVCQFMLGPIGDQSGSSVAFMCGVLALPELETGPCTEGAVEPTVTDLWWTSSSGTGAFSGATHFRLSRYGTGSFTVQYNANIYVQDGNSETFYIQLIPLTPASNVEAAFQSPMQIVKFDNHDPLRIDALFGRQGQIYGQLWDAFLWTQAIAIDSEFDYTSPDTTIEPDSSWIAWNNGVPGHPDAGGGTVLATLFLLKEPILSDVVQNFTY